METKKTFKPFDKVLCKENKVGSRWHCAFFSDYNETNGCVNFADGLHCHFTKIDILPYEGNEHLVGTTDEPAEEVKLEEGETIFCTSRNGLSLIDKELDVFCLRRYISTHNNMFNGEWSYAIRFSDFNPNDMEETKKHILCVKDGKVVRYREL